MDAWRIAFPILLVLTACAPAAPTTSPRPSAQLTPERAATQRLRIATASLGASIAPEAQGVLVWLNAMAFDSLTRMDPQLQPAPGVAQSWEQLADGTGWRFRLRDDLRWPDGSPLTAEDVAWTMQTMIQDRWLGVSNFPAVTAARAVDRLTVDFLTRGPDVSTLINAAYFFVVPRALYERLGQEAFARQPQGTGPYAVVEFIPSDRVTWRRREGYRHPYRSPILTEVQLRAVPDTASALAGLRSGELDFLIGVTNPELIEQAERAGLKTYRRVTSNFVILVDATASRGTPLAQKAVRQALSYAIDRDQIATQLFKGTAVPMGQLGLPGAPMHLPELKPYPFDQRRARELLAAAGYPNGFTLAGGIDFSPAFHSEPLTLAFQDFLRQIGVEAKINRWEASVWQEKLFGRNNQTRSELYPVTYGDANGLMTFGRSLLTCTNSQAVLVCVPEFDRLMDLASSEVDTTQRTRYLQAANRAFVEELPAVFIIASGPTYVMRPNVQGFAPSNVTFFTYDEVYLSN
ncbi:MAG: ABC transporter substrate-binding protein [Chloroflexi bacterium]|nr:ABC transporter substrate-binding protein [Chloroflexota bacterium]